MVLLGLWPPHQPSNEARLEPERGLVLRGPGQLVSRREVSLPGSAFTVEAWLEHDPDRLPGANQEILALLDGEAVEPLLLGHWPEGYLLRLRRDNPEGAPPTDRYTRWPPSPSPQHVAIVGEGDQVRIHHDGHLARTVASNDTDVPLRGRLVLGTSGRGWPRWAGAIQAVAVYDRALDEATLRDHAGLTGEARRVRLDAEAPFLHAVFTDADGVAASFERPDDVSRVAPPLLGWRLGGKGAWRWILADGLLNVLFFLPLGFLVARGGGARGVVAALLVGFGLSLAIEVGQFAIPGRSSSALDLIANTLGAGLGALMAQAAARRAARSLPAPLALALALTLLLGEAPLPTGAGGTRLLPRLGADERSPHDGLEASEDVLDVAGLIAVALGGEDEFPGLRQA